MKLPENSLKAGIEIKSGMGDPVQFPAGTLLFAFWNEDYVPAERYEELKEARRYHRGQDKLIMCIIGTYWVAIPESSIRRGR
jgi:hypothetical protein